MSTTVFKNRAPSCFESLLSDTSTATLKLKMVAPPPSDIIDHPTNPKFGNSVFPQTFHMETGDSYTERDNYKGCPWAKKSPSSILSAKSLELCTEALGNETGSDVVTGGDAAIFYSSKSSDDYSAPKRAESDGHWKRKLNSNSQKKTNQSFPPPLTTMSGARSVQVQPHREGGRLIIETVEAPFVNSYLQAVRSDGRLRLRFMTAEGINSGAAGEEDEDEDDDWDGELAAGEEVKVEEKTEEAESDEVKFDQSKEKTEIDDEEIKNNLEMEKEIEKYQWLSSCKLGDGHGNKGLCGNWKPALWVATS